MPIENREIEVTEEFVSTLWPIGIGYIEPPRFTGKDCLLPKWPISDDECRLTNIPVSGRGQMPLPAQPAPVGGAPVTDSGDDRRVERIALGAIAPLAGAHPLPLVGRSFRLHGKADGGVESQGREVKRRPSPVRA